MLAQEKVDPVKPPEEANEQRTSYFAGEKQELLSPSAAYAIEAQDIALLKTLRAAGWNPSLPLGRMPDSRYEVKFTPLTLASGGAHERSLDWLINTCKVALEARDNSGMRGIDWATFDEKEDSHNLAIVNLLKREGQPVEKDALAELAYNITRKSMRLMRLHTVNGEEAVEVWKGFDELLKVEQAEEKRRMTATRSEQNKPEPKMPLANQDTSEIAEDRIDDLVVQWTRVDNNTYKFSFTTSSHAMSGGEMSGRIYFKYGYWLSKVEKAWDS